MRIEFPRPNVILSALLWAVLLLGALGPEAPAFSNIFVVVRTDREDATYILGGRVVFSISVYEYGRRLKSGEVDVALTLDGAKTLADTTLPLGSIPAEIDRSLVQPGFLRCTAIYVKDGTSYRGTAVAAFGPELLKPAAAEPEDFEDFWRAGQKQLESSILDVELTLLPRYCDDRQQSYKLSLANVDGTRCYGFLRIPSKVPPPFPALVTLVGAGPGPFEPEAWDWVARGAMVLTVSVHDYDCGASSKEIKASYAQLTKDKKYPALGAPDRGKYYFRRAILGIDRAIDYLAAREDFDGRHLVVTGTSQGGGLALIMAGLNRRVTAAAANAPAMCDHAAGLAGRKPGWPQLLAGVEENERAAYLDMASYFDVVNFALRITCPVIVSAGFIDEQCPPSSIYSAFNVIKAPKRIFTAPRTGHGVHIGDFPAFRETWIAEKLGLIGPGSSGGP